MRRRHGFTLIELLVATMMLAIVAGAGLAALSSGTRSAATVRRYNAMVAHGQAALEQMSCDIRAMVQHGEVGMTSLDTEYEGMDADTLDFIVAALPRLEHDEPGGTGRCEVGYYIENDPDTEHQWLLRREDASIDEDALEGGAVSLAGPFVASVNFQFYDGMYWQSGWESQEVFPKIVSIQVYVVDEDEIEQPMAFATTVPIMAR